MIVLFDYDSLIYLSCYKVCSISDIKSWFIDGKDREWMEREILDLSINKLNNMTYNVLEAIEETGVQISDVEYYITKVKDCFRRAIYPEYKANRTKRVDPMRKWVSMVRSYLLKSEFAKVHDNFEADDLVADRAKEIGHSKCVICSPDKDLKQIAGIHYSYYKHPQKDEYEGLDVITEKEAELFLLKQVLMGDSSDNIKGLPNVGNVKADKILQENKENPLQAVKMAYKHKYDDNETAAREFQLNYELVYLGTRGTFGRDNLDKILKLKKLIQNEQRDEN